MKVRDRTWSKPVLWTVYLGICVGAALTATLVMWVLSFLWFLLTGEVEAWR